MRRKRIAAAFVVVFAVAAVVGSSSPSAHGAQPWTWPVMGEVITHYRNGGDPYAGGQHRGIDVAARVGAPVVAATGGTVRFAGLAGSSGLTVSIRTSDGRFDTSYLHLASTEVREGDRVEGGNAIGAVGTSGRRSVPAPHLHFGVRDAASRHAYRDPLDFLPALAPRPVAEAPRGAPVPVGVPQLVRPLRVPVLRPSPIRRPAADRRRIRVPAGRPVRVPAARPVRVPAGKRQPKALPGLRPSPLPVARGLRAPAASSPAPHTVPTPGPAPAPAPHPQAPPAGSPRPAAGPAAESGLDLGWALACAGLLLAAACLGRPGGGTAQRRSGGAALLSWLRPLLGRR